MITKSARELGKTDGHRYTLRECKNCKQKRWVTVSSTRRSNYIGFCHTCNLNKRTMENHPRWNGGKIIVRGYILVKRPDHPFANRNGYVYEHRLVMADLFGIEALKDMVVHHKDRDKTNNHPSNLKLMENYDHLCLHNSRLRKATT